MEQLTQVQIKQMIDRVLAVRYSNLELECTLCLELLTQGEAQGDCYTTFAQTYLGDYFIAKRDTTHCTPHLLEARDLAVEGATALPVCAAWRVYQR